MLSRPCLLKSFLPWCHPAFFVFALLMSLSEVSLGVGCLGIQNRSFGTVCEFRLHGFEFSARSVGFLDSFLRPFPSTIPLQEHQGSVICAERFSSLCFAGGYLTARCNKKPPFRKVSSFCRQRLFKKRGPKYMPRGCKTSKDEYLAYTILVLPSLRYILVLGSLGICTVFPAFHPIWLPCSGSNCHAAVAGRSISHLLWGTISCNPKRGRPGRVGNIL